MKTHEPDLPYARAECIRKSRRRLYQLILGLVLICYSSYRGIVELFRDLFDLSISIGTVHNRLQETAEKAAEINQSQDLSGIEVGLLDEIFQANKPVLAGVELSLPAVESRGFLPEHASVFHEPPLLHEVSGA